MKITQVLKTHVHLKLSEIPHVPVGFRLTGVSSPPCNADRIDREHTIILDGEMVLETN